MVTSLICMRSMHDFMTSTGHGDPAMTPVRNELRSNESKSGWLSSATNMVGTP